MSNTMTAHEPIKYLDSILNEEEKRCEYSHQWRNFTISRSGRFKSKNKTRDAVDGKLFDATNKLKDNQKEQEKISAGYSTCNNNNTTMKSCYSSNTPITRNQRDKKETYKFV